MNKFFVQNFPKPPNPANMTRMALGSISFHSSTIQSIMVDTSKFTNEGKVWNNFCAQCFIKETPLHHSPSLYSGTSKGLSVGDLVDGLV